MSKKTKGATYLLIAGVIAAFLGWLWYKHAQLAKKIGLGQPLETVSPDIQTTLVEPQETPYMGAPL